MKASYIHWVPLATNNKIEVLHRLFTTTLNSATFQDSIANVSATLQHVLKCYCNLSIQLRNIGEPFPELSVFLRVKFGYVYTATFRMPRRECMRVHTERTRWQSFTNVLINDTEWFPKLVKCYRQPFCKVSRL